MNVTVTKAQAQMIADVESAKVSAARDAGLVVSAITAGLVPDGAVLTGVDVTTGVLTFHVEPATDAD